MYVGSRHNKRLFIDTRPVAIYLPTLTGILKECTESAEVKGTSTSDCPS